MTYLVTVLVNNYGRQFLKSWFLSHENVDACISTEVIADCTYEDRKACCISMRSSPLWLMVNIRDIGMPSSRYAQTSWQTHFQHGYKPNPPPTHCESIEISLWPLISTNVTHWWRSTVVERRSLAGELSLTCTRPAADGWPLMWVNHPLQVSQLGQLSLSSFRGRQNE